MPGWIWFEFYGELEYLDRVSYMRGPWKYVCSCEGDDGGVYDIVRNTKTDEYRFTEI